MKNLITVIAALAFIAGLFAMVEVAFLYVPWLGVVGVLGALVYLLVVAAQAINDDLS